MVFPAASTAASPALANLLTHTAHNPPIKTHVIQLTLDLTYKFNCETIMRVFKRNYSWKCTDAY